MLVHEVFIASPLNTHSPPTTRSVIILRFQGVVVAGIYVILERLLVVGIAWLHTYWTVSSWSDWAWESRSTSTGLTGSEDIVQVRHTDWWCLVGWGLKVYKRNRSGRNCTNLDWVSKRSSFYISVLFSDTNLICVMFAFCDFQNCS